MYGINEKKFEKKERTDNTPNKKKTTRAPFVVLL